MNDNQALLARLYRDKLDYLFSSVLNLPGEKTEVQIFEPQSQHDEKWVIIARGYTLRVTEEMIGQLADYCESETPSLQWLDMIDTIVNNPTDKSLELKPYVDVATDVTELLDNNTLTGDDYECIDTQFLAIYASLKSYYQHLFELFRSASQHHHTVARDLTQDVSLRVRAKTDLLLDLEIIFNDGVHKNDSTAMHYLYSQGRFVKFFADAEDKDSLSYGDQIASCLDNINGLLMDFIANQDGEYRQSYATMIVDDFVLMMERIHTNIPYYQLGDNLDNIEDYPDVMAAIDALTTKVLQHVHDIPLTAMGENVLVDHYAFDYENFIIYARDKDYNVIGELTDSAYAILPLFDTVTESALALLNTHLARLRSKHVFKKLGKLIMAENPNVLH